MKTTAEQEQAVNTIYFGCDISKASFTVAARQAGLGPIQPAQLRKLTITRFERTAQGANKFLAMARQIAGKAEMVIVMESTGSYSLELCCWLWKASAGVPIAAVPPKRIHDWCSGTGVRAKTDNIDAALIACYGAERQPRAPGPGPWRVRGP